jgi:hypothetical protein
MHVWVSIPDGRGAQGAWEYHGILSKETITGFYLPTSPQSAFTNRNLSQGAFYFMKPA